MRRLSLSTIAIAVIAAGCGSSTATTHDASTPAKTTHHKPVRRQHKKRRHHRKHRRVGHHRARRVARTTTTTATTTATTTYTPPPTTTYTPPPTTTTTVAPTVTHQVTTTVQHHTTTTTTKQGYCLSVTDRIATPRGSVPVADVAPGMRVWSTDLSGRRVVERVLRVRHRSVPASHLMVRLRLQDGRSVLVSLSHPLPDGAAVSTLVAGQRFEGTRVVSTTRVRYGRPFTYDLLPAGPTHTYFADGVLLGSTLVPALTHPF